MLVDLRIENLVLVERAQIAFSKGLNVISGETGAGKTLLVQALTLLTGTRASTELVRTGAEAAVIEARFELRGEVGQKVCQRLEALGLPQAGEELVVRRRITREGKSRVYINDASATATSLAELTFDLVELTGQLEQYGLLRSERHIELLDAFAGTGLLKSQVTHAVRKLKAQADELAEMEAALAHRNERDEFLRFYLQEFETLSPQAGEDEELMERAKRLQHADRLLAGVDRARQALYEGEPSAYDLLARSLNELEPLVSADSRLQQPIEELGGILDSIDQLQRSLAHYSEEVVSNPEELETIEARLHQIQKLCRKHGVTLEQLIEKMQGARDELSRLSDLEVHIEEARHQVLTYRQTAVELARSLTSLRRGSIERLRQDTERHLMDLGFKHCRFEVDLQTDDDPAHLADNGADHVAFLLCANPGEPMRPLAKVASGGELSRMLLALKCALAQVDTVPVHVFDEIDTGIGGGMAEIVGRKIRELADHTQVLCVTHLPQIASFADTHLTVIKQVGPAGTRTMLSSLDQKGREEEIARMLGGVEITSTTRQHAREMLSRSSLAS